MVSANLYSLVETTKANGVEPHAYLSLLFAQLPYAKTVEDRNAAAVEGKTRPRWQRPISRRARATDIRMSRSGRIIIFVAVACIALAAYSLTFELRYMWYLTPRDAAFIRSIELSAMGAMIALWILWPSRLAVVIVALGGFLIPPLYNAQSFVRMDWRFAGPCLISIALLTVATKIRRRLDGRAFGALDRLPKD